MLTILRPFPTVSKEVCRMYMPALACEPRSLASEIRSNSEFHSVVTM
jgi:hypothetical protein